MKESALILLSEHRASQAEDRKEIAQLLPIRRCIMRLRSTHQRCSQRYCLKVNEMLQFLRNYPC